MSRYVIRKGIQTIRKGGEGKPYFSQLERDAASLLLNFI